MKAIPFYLIIAFLILSFGCNKEKAQRFGLQGEVFGTTYEIIYFDHSDRTFEIETGIDSIYTAVNTSVSTFLPESDISRINSGEESILIDDIFLEIFLLSKKIYHESHGYFDPTVGSLRNAYGFGDIEPLPGFSARTIDSIMAYVGFEKVNLSPAGFIVKDAPQVYLDFNAIAKGYAVDLISNYLISLGIENLMIEIGGEVTVRGSNISSGDFWKIGLERFDSEIENRRIRETVTLENKSIAGSGNYRNFRLDSLTGKRFVHTINAINGKAETNGMLSAYVIAESCALADGYATAFMAMGISKSKEMLQELDSVEAYFVYSEDSRKISTYYSEGFKKMINN